MTKKRIFVSADEDQQKILAEIAEKDKRSISFVATQMFTDGINLRSQPESAMSYQEKIASELIKKKGNGQ